jgi:hypothetical protein
MEKNGIKLRIVAVALSLCLILIPMSSSVSMTQHQISSANAQAGAMGTDGMSAAAIVRISAAVVAAGVFIAVTANDDEVAAGNNQR